MVGVQLGAVDGLLGTPFDLLEYKTLTHIHPSHDPMHMCLFLSNPFSLSLSLQVSGRGGGGGGRGQVDPSIRDG